MDKLEKEIFDSYIRNKLERIDKHWFTVSTTSNYAKKSIIVTDLLDIYPVKLFESNNWLDLLEEATNYYKGLTHG